MGIFFWVIFRIIVVFLLIIGIIVYIYKRYLKLFYIIDDYYDVIVLYYIYI